MWGGIARATSPPTEGSSILMTSAPRSASWSVPHGPAPNCSSASTRTSASGSMRHLRRELDLGQELRRLDGRMKDDVLGARGDVLGDALGALRGRAGEAVALDRVGRELGGVAAREVDTCVLDGTADERRQHDCRRDL